MSSKSGLWVIVILAFGIFCSAINIEFGNYFILLFFMMMAFYIGGMQE